MNIQKIAGKPQRLDGILQRLLEDDQSTAQSLAVDFNVSVMTIHRDLDELQRRGMVRKFHGGVSVARTGNYEIAASLRRQIATPRKQLLANAAVKLIEPGQAVMLDDSTTVALMASSLAEIEGLSVATNYLSLITELSGVGDLEVRAIGGVYDHSHESFLGLGAVHSVRELRVDIAFISTSSADMQGLYHQEEKIVELKSAMLGAARRKILLMDSSKLMANSMHRVSGWESIDDVLTDEDAPEPLLSALKSRGINVHIVPTNNEETA